jgi:hypothetical protein
VAHVAFEVDDLAKAIRDQRVIIAPDSPTAEASTGSFRTAVIRTLIEMGPSPRASSATRHAITVAFSIQRIDARPFTRR